MAGNNIRVKPYRYTTTMLCLIVMRGGGGRSSIPEPPNESVFHRWFSFLLQTNVLAEFRELRDKTTGISGKYTKSGILCILCVLCVR